MSLLSVLKHANRIVPNFVPVGAIQATIAPFAIYTGAFIGAVNSDSTYISDHYSMFASMYANSRGSVRYQVSVDTTSALSAFQVATLSYDITTTTGGIVEGAATSTPRYSLAVTQHREFRGGTDIQVPGYHKTYARCNVNDLVGSGTLVKDFSQISSSNVVLVVDTKTGFPNQYFRQVGDDFHLSNFISTPCTAAR